MAERIIGGADYELRAVMDRLKADLADADRVVKQTGQSTEDAFAKKGTAAADRMAGAAKGVGTQMDSVGQKSRGLGSMMQGALVGIGFAAVNIVANAVQGLGDKVGEAIDLASNKAEAASKANVLFGDSYDIVADKSRSAATDVGLSSGAYLEAAGNVGNLVKNFDFAGDQAAQMSTDIVQLAADMGSFNNASTVEVTEAIGAAFRGEMEPLRRFGVMLDQASIKAQAVGMGLAASTKEVSKQDAALASYQLILEQTTAAQGDFARTSDGYANSQRIAAAKQEEAFTRLGEAILPLAQKIMPMLADTVTALVGALADLIGVAESASLGLRDLFELWNPKQKELRESREEVTAWADALAELPEAAGLSRLALEGMARRAQEAGEGLAGAKKELIDLVRWINATENPGSQLAGMVRNFERWTEMVDKGIITTDQFNGKVRGLVRGGLSELSDNLDILPPKLAEVVTAFASGQDAVDIFVRQWTEIGSKWPAGGPAWTQFLKDNADLIAKHWDMLPAHVQAALKQTGADTGEWAGTIAQVYQARLVNSMQGFWSGEGFKSLAPPPTLLSAVLPGSFAGLADAAREAVAKAAAEVARLGPSFRDGIRDSRGTVRAAMQDLRWAIEHPMQGVKLVAFIEGKLTGERLAKGLASKHRDTRTEAERTRAILIEEWEKATGKAWDYGKSIDENLGAGMKNKRHRVRDEARDVADAARDPLKGVASKSEGWGSAAVEHFAAGIAAPAPNQHVKTAAEATAEILKKAMKQESPAETGPLSKGGGTYGWGLKAGALFASGIRASTPDVANAMAAMTMGAIGPGPRVAISGSLGQTTTVVQRHEGTIRVDLSAASVAAMRDAGYSGAEVGDAVRHAAGMDDVLRQFRHESSLPVGAVGAW